MPKSDMLGQFEQYILTAVIALGDDAYGKAVHERTCKLAERNVNLGSVYVTLDRLEDKGYVKSWDGPPLPERGGRSRRYYAIEPAGIQALEDSVAAAARVSETFWKWIRTGDWKLKRG